LEREVLERIENVLGKGEQLLEHHTEKGVRGLQIDTGPYREWHTQGLTVLDAVFGRNHTYTQAFLAWTSRASTPHTVNDGLGTLRAAYEDLSKGYTRSFKELVHADVFDDYLEMAASLLADGGHKDAAAVIAGSTLEEHLRKLCQKNGIDTTREKSNGDTEPRKASTLNDDLHKATVITQIEWRSNQGWLDIRNASAHGKYENYTKEQVKQMIDGIRDFLSRHPA
jgi:hypothetical protein